MKTTFLTIFSFISALTYAQKKDSIVTAVQKDSLITAIEGTSFNFYPNPASNILYTSATNTIDICDLKGVKYSLTQLLDGSIDISSLPEGLYFLNKKRLLIKH